MHIVRSEIPLNLLAISVRSKLLTMDIKLISCVLFFMVLFTTNVHKTNTAASITSSTAAPAATTTVPTVTSPATTKATTSATAKPGNTSPVTNAPGNAHTTAKTGNSSPVSQGGTKAPGNTTPAPKQCVSGSCTATGDDESCLQNIQGKCPLAHSCTKEVKKQNATHSVVTVGCSVCPTKPAITTTVKPPTPAPSTTTITCCETDLCNQYQTPQSAAFGLRTNIIFYAIGLLAFKICI